MVEVGGGRERGRSRSYKTQGLCGVEERYVGEDCYWTVIGVEVCVAVWDDGRADENNI